MKARVKATGEIVEISEELSYVIAEHFDKYYNLEQIEFLDVKEKSFPKDGSGVVYIDPTIDYWTRLEHQAAIAAMGGMDGNAKYNDYAWVDMAEEAIRAAHALVQKLKEKEE